MIFLNPGNPRFRQPCHFSGMRNCRVATAIAAAPQKGWFTTPLRLYPLLWQPECWHWQVSFVPALASAHAVLQCLLPSAGAQLQAGCAHFLVGVIKVLLQVSELCAPAPQRSGRCRKHTLRKLGQHCIDGSNNLFRFAHRRHPMCRRFAIAAKSRRKSADPRL